MLFARCSNADLTVAFCCVLAGILTDWDICYRERFTGVVMVWVVIVCRFRWSCAGS